PCNGLYPAFTGLQLVSETTVTTAATHKPDKIPVPIKPFLFGLSPPNDMGSSLNSLLITLNCEAIALITTSDVNSPANAILFNSRRFTFKPSAIAWVNRGAW